MKIYYVVRIDSYYETNDCGYPDLDGEIITEETPLLDKGIFAKAADAVVLVGDLLRSEKDMWAQYSDCDPVLVGTRVYARRGEMETYPNCFTAFTVREREVIGS